MEFPTFSRNVTFWDVDGEPVVFGDAGGTRVWRNGKFEPFSTESVIRSGVAIDEARFRRLVLEDTADTIANELIRNLNAGGHPPLTP